MFMNRPTYMYIVSTETGSLVAWQGYCVYKCVCLNVHIYLVKLGQPCNVLMP